MGRFKAVMVGVGGFGKELAMGAATCKYFHMVGAYDSQMQFLGEFRRTFDVKLYPSYDAILADKSVEGVVLATPNNTHLDLIKRAAAAGKHIFVEKPITNTIPDAREAIKACKDAGVTLMVGHVARRTSAARMAKKVLESGRLGKVVLIEGHIAHRGGLDLTPQSWRWYEERCPGGPVMQLAIHTIDTFHYLIGPTKSVSAKISRLATPAEIQDTGVLALEFESGVLGFVGTAYTVPGSTFTHIYGSEAILSYDRKEGEFQLRHRDGHLELSPPLAAVNATADELDEFARCAMGKTKPETAGEEGLQALAVVVAALKSSKEGRSVTIKEVLEQ